MEINIRRLQHLIALAEQKSFAKAAVRVHLSQPALSRSIQTLEQDLDIQLIDRAGRGATLTTAGNIVVERARRVLFEARCLVRDTELIKKHELGEISFGVGPYPAMIFLADVLASLGKSHPKMRIRAEVNNWGALVDKLHAETIDFLVVDKRAIPRSVEIDIRRLPAHRAGWFVRTGHPLLKKRSVSTAELRLYPFVAIPLPDTSRAAFLKLLRISPTEEMNPFVECNDLFVLKELTLQADTILFATVSAVRNEIASGQLTQLSLAEEVDLKVEFGIAYLAQRTLSPEAEIAIAEITSVMADMADMAVTQHT